MPAPGGDAHHTEGRTALVRPRPHPAATARPPAPSLPRLLREGEAIQLAHRGSGRAV